MRDADFKRAVAKKSYNRTGVNHLSRRRIGQNRVGLHECRRAPLDGKFAARSGPSANGGEAPELAVCSAKPTPTWAVAPSKSHASALTGNANKTHNRELPGGSMKRRRFIIVGLVAGPLLLLVVVTLMPDWTLPSLLWDVRSTGESYCPGETSAATIEQRTSSWLNRRLALRFPKGTESAVVLSSLNDLGFRPAGVCQRDGSIRFARFDSPGTFLHLYPVTAMVYWKVDAKHRVLWVRGSTGEPWTYSSVQ